MTAWQDRDAPGEVPGWSSALGPLRVLADGQVVAVGAVALIRDAGVTAAQLRILLQLSAEALQAVTDLIKHTAQKE